MARRIEGTIYRLTYTYYLSPIDEKNFSVGQFSIDTRSFAQARKEAKAWIKEKFSEYKIIVVEV